MLYFTKCPHSFPFILIIQIPEVVEEFKEKNNVAMFVSQNVGLLIGIGLMLTIAIFEDQIKIT